jgi:hypothetical protein
MNFLIWLSSARSNRFSSSGASIREPVLFSTSFRECLRRPSPKCLYLFMQTKKMRAASSPPMKAVPNPTPATALPEKYNGGEHEGTVEYIIVVTIAVDPEIVEVTVGSVIGTMMVVETEPVTAIPSEYNVAGIATSLENMVSLRGNADAVGTGNDESDISVTTDC